MPKMRLKADRLYLRPRAEVERTVMRYFLIGLRLAGRAFIIEAEKHVPVYTGMALGSLKPLGELVKYEIPIFGKPTEAWDRGQKVLKDENLGEKQGSASIYRRNATTALLKVETKVWHYDLRDIHEITTDRSGLAAPTPWESFTQGAEAASRELIEYLNFKLQDFVVFAVRGKVKESLTESPVEIIRGR